MSAGAPATTGATSSRRGQPKYGRVYPLREVHQARQGREERAQDLQAAPSVDDAVAELAAAFARVIVDATRRQPGAAGSGGGGTRVSDATPSEPERLLVGIPTACEMLGIGKTVVGDMIRRGELVSVTIGSRRLIPIQAIEAYVAEQIERAREDIAAGRVPGL